MTDEDDRRSDRRILVTFAGLMFVEIVLGILADAGTIGLNWWLGLAVGAILVTGGVSAVLQRGLE